MLAVVEAQGVGEDHSIGVGAKQMVRHPKGVSCHVASGSVEDSHTSQQAPRNTSLSVATSYVLLTVAICRSPYDCLTSRM